jgi:dTDP-glucose 4,6-dehydratase
MRLNDGRVVPTFISQALRHKPVTVFGKGRQTRCFCYVSDLIEGIYRLMMSNYDLPMNIGNPAELTVLEFAKEIIRATKSRSKIVFKPLPQDDPKQRKPDITVQKKSSAGRPKFHLIKASRKPLLISGARFDGGVCPNDFPRAPIRIRFSATVARHGHR